MFLKILLQQSLTARDHIKKKKITSNASRNIRLYQVQWQNHFRLKKLSMKLRSRSGRGGSGQSILKSKGPFLKAFRLLKTNTYNRENSITFTLGTHYDTLTGKFLSLILTHNNFKFYSPTSVYRKIFALAYPTCTVSNLRTFFINPTTTILYKANLTSKLSNSKE